MGLFKGFGGAKPTMKAKYFQPGRYITVLKRTKKEATRKSGMGYFFEQKIVGVIDPGPKEPALRVGMEVGHGFFTGGKGADTFAGNLKAALIEIMRATDPTVDLEAELGESDEAWEKFIEEDVLRDQIFSGVYLEVSAHEVETKAGNPFTVIQYMRGFTASQLRETLAFIKQDEDQALGAGVLQAQIDAEAAPAA